MSDLEPLESLEEPPRPGIRGFLERHYTVLTLIMPAMLIGMGRGFTIPVLPGIAMDYGVGAAGAGLLVLMPMVGAVVATLPTGYLIDRIGRRKILIAGPTLASFAAFMIFFTAGSYIEFLVYMSVGGIAQQMWQMSRLAAIADSGPQGQRGRQITSMAGVQRFGTLVGPLAGGVVGEVFGLRVPFAMFGFAALLATVPTYALIKETAPPVLARLRGETTKTDTSWATLLTRPVLILFIAQFFANIGRGGVVGQGGPYFIFAAYAFGIGPAILGYISFGTGLFGIPITLLAGQIMDRFGRKRTIVPASAMLGIGLLAMSVTAGLQLNFAIFVGAFVFINLAISLMAGSMQTLGSDVAPAEARGKFFGVIRLVAEAGSMSNPATFSLSTLWIAGAAGFATAFGIMGISAIFTAALVGFLVRETLRTK